MAYVNLNDFGHEQNKPKGIGVSAVVEGGANIPIGCLISGIEEDRCGSVKKRSGRWSLTLATN